MAQNGEVTEYDDNGYPLNARSTAVVTFAGGVVKASPGRLIKIVVTTVFAGTLGVLTFYDNASAASGTVLFVIPQISGTVGTTFTVDLPAVNGIYAGVSGTLSGGAVTVGYS